jgi:hypothetical protein
MRLSPHLIATGNQTTSLRLYSTTSTMVWQGRKWLPYAAKSAYVIRVSLRVVYGVRPVQPTGKWCEDKDVRAHALPVA